jgi:hypothetical protein
VFDCNRLAEIQRTVSRHGLGQQALVFITFAGTFSLGDRGGHVGHVLLMNNGGSLLHEPVDAAPDIASP